MSGFRSSRYTSDGAMPQMASTDDLGGFLTSLPVLPAAIYSITKRLNPAAQKCLRLRRSSDNAERDFGFVGPRVDFARMAAWVGSDSAFLVKRYDQMGLSPDLAQATAANQPRLFNAGVYDAKAIYDGTNDSMAIASFQSTTPYLGIYMNGLFANQSATGILFESSANYNNNPGAVLASMTSFIWSNGMNNASASTQRANNYSTASVVGMSRMTFLYDRTLTGSGEVVFRINGALQSSTGGLTTEQTGNFVANNLYFGARAGSSFYAPIQEETIVIYTADTAAIAAQIEALIA